MHNGYGKTMKLQLSISELALLILCRSSRSEVFDLLGCTCHACLLVRAHQPSRPPSFRYLIISHHVAMEFPILHLSQGPPIRVLSLPGSTLTAGVMLRLHQPTFDKRS